MKDICEGVTRYKFGAIGISNWYRIEQISEHIGEHIGKHIGIYTSEHKIGTVYGRILGLVDEATKHNWCHWFFVAILFWACAQWSRIFTLWNWAVWTKNCYSKGCWYCLIDSMITGPSYTGPSTRIDWVQRKKDIFTSQKQFFFFLKSQIFAWIFQSSQLKSFFSKSFF